jgi:TrmH family RNA methyltransferase
MTPPTRHAVVGLLPVSAALDAGEPVRVLLVPREGTAPEEALAARAEGLGVTVWRGSEGDLFRMSRGEPARVLAMVGPPATAHTVGELLARPGAVWLLSGASYPSNVGFAIRTAEVSGATGLVVDGAFSGAQRSRARHVSMGAHRLLPVLYASSGETLATARAAGRRIVAIEDVGAVAPWEADLRGDVVLMLGNERDGLSRELLDAADVIVRIPMAGFVPSYNLQAAMTALATERLRQVTP